MKPFVRLKLGSYPLFKELPVQGKVKLYRKLLQERMISPPFVSRTELGITGNGSDMRVNDQVLRIVELPKLQTSGRNWKAVVVKRDE